MEPPRQKPLVVNGVIVGPLDTQNANFALISGSAF